MSDGQLAINTEATSPGLFFKNSSGDLVKVGPVHVGTTAPNVSPAAGGQTGNTLGEQWLDTTGGTYVFKVWDGSAWRSETGTFVDVNGDTMTGALGIIAGTAGAPGLFISGDTNTGIYSPGADQLAVSTGGAERLVVDASGNVTINGQGDIRFADSDSSNWVSFQAPATISSNVTWTLPSVDGTSGQVLSTNGSGTLSWATNTASGDNIEEGNTSAEVIDTGSDGRFVVTTEGSERLRIDSSGRLLVGTSSARANFFNTTSTADSPALQLEGTSFASGLLSLTSNRDLPGAGPHLMFGSTRGTTVGSNTIAQNGDELGTVSWQGADGSELIEAARIAAYVDGTPGSDDMPGRLVFSTTADGASSPTERMRINADGSLWVGQTTQTNVGVNNTVNGFALSAGGTTYTAVNSAPPLYVNRNTNDGDLVSLRQGGTQEGSISVSGTSVSYNGAHLSRWSQLPGGAPREEILRGTVLTNIDEMCTWGEEDNEQLNRMKVSDVEGDSNVSGVFQSWDDDDDTYTDDFYCAMTGDFIIRIADGVTVQRGDLLMSAGDGTAKPQDDDIIRSKTIAKVTSIHVTCTYADGSYCVPCVLMAC